MSGFSSRNIELPAGDIVGTTDTQTLTDKTLTSPVINSPTGIVKGDVGLGNVDNTSDATKNSATVTLVNKTLTAPIIGPNILSVNGALAFDSTQLGIWSSGALRYCITNTQSQTLTNKTLTSPVINSPTGIVKGDVGLGNVDNTSDATKDAAVATLTNKTLVAPIGVPYILAQSFALITHTGTLSATTLATVTVPANMLGANDALRITALWSAAANNANSKLATVRFGGTLYSQVSLASQLAARTEIFIANANATNAQIGGLAGNNNLAATDYLTGTSDTTTAVNLTFQCTLGNTGDTVYLRGYIVEVLKG